MRDPRPDFSLVVETANLSFVPTKSLLECFESLHDGDLRPSDAREILLVGGKGPGQTCFTQLRDRFPRLRIIELPGNPTYVECKVAGSLAAQSEIVVFVDSDCRYSPRWLEVMLAPLADSRDIVVTAETAVPISSPYTLAIGLVWTFPPYSTDRDLSPTPVYWANGFAIPRVLLEAFPIEHEPGTSRVGTARHAYQIVSGGYRILRQPLAQVRHAPSNLLLKMLWQGHDSVLLGKQFADPQGNEGQWKRRASTPWNRARLIMRQNKSAWRWFPTAVPIASAGIFSYALGRLIGRFLPRRLDRILPVP